MCVCFLVFIEDEETQYKNNRSFPSSSRNIVTMVVGQLCECRCVDERNTWLSLCGLSRWTATELKILACAILCFLFYLILFSSFLFLFLFIFLQVSSLYLFLFLFFFIFYKTERNSAAHEPSCLCLPFHLSMLSAWLIYGHLFWQTRTRCRTRSETTSEQL